MGVLPLSPLVPNWYDLPMAIFHLETQVISRADGRSSVACAAYRSGEVLLDDRTGTPHRYGDPARVAHTEIIAPPGAPAWALDREQLWNRVESGERRKDSQLAREWELALPAELTLDQNRELVRGWVESELTPRGAIADIAIHDERKPDEPYNPHAHVMGTLRSLNGDIWGAKHERGTHRSVLLQRWRSSWAEHTNRALARAGYEITVSHLSHAARGLEVKPMIKEGPGARGIEARGGVSERMAKNRRIRDFNKKLRDHLRDFKGRVLDTFTRGPSKKAPATVTPNQPAVARPAAQARSAPTPAPQQLPAAAGPTLPSRGSAPKATPKAKAPAPPLPVSSVLPSPGLSDEDLARWQREQMDRGR